MAAQAPESPRQPFEPATLPATEEKRRYVPHSFSDFNMGQDARSQSLPAWVAADLVLALGATGLAVSLAFPPGANHSMHVHLTLLVTSYVALLLLALNTFGLYERESNVSPLREGLNVCKAVTVASVIFLIVQVSAQPEATPPKFVLAAALVNAAALASWRIGSRTLTHRRVGRGKAVRHALIVGSGQLGRSLAASIECNRNLRIVVKGFVDDRGAEGEKVLGKLADFLTVARAEFIDEIYITLPIMRSGILDLINRARERHISVKVVPPLLEGHNSVAVQFIGAHTAFTLHEEPVRGFAKLFKRLVDIVGSSILIVLTAPLLLIIAITVKLDSKGPVFYCADRVGFKGRKFRFYKFRTMVQNADELKEKLRQLNEREGPFFKIANDPRLTRTGKFLRATSLDELPQIFNVLASDMSLVGPRPHPVDDYRQYRLEHLRRLDVMPGITGLWQVTARADPSFERNMQLDLDYIDRWSFWLDLKILAKTLPAVIRKEGV
jgi:exopolysaccharide biosynthesis polyprenyl glycosylphosphotransferase